MGPFSQTVSGTATVEKSLLNKWLSQKLHVFKALLTRDTGVTQIYWSLPCLTPMMICAFRVTLFAVWNSFTSLLLNFTYNEFLFVIVTTVLTRPLMCRQASQSVWFHCMALSQCISSDVIMINVNHAGFTVCLFYGAVGRVALGPSTRAPAGSVRRWTGGFGWCLPWYSAVTLARMRTSKLNRGCVVSHEWLQTFPTFWKLTDFSAEAVPFDTEDWLPWSTIIQQTLFSNNYFWLCLHIIICSMLQLTCAAHSTSQFSKVIMVIHIIAY